MIKSGQRYTDNRTAESYGIIGVGTNQTKHFVDETSVIYRKHTEDYGFAGGMLVMDYQQFTEEFTREMS